MIKLVIFDLDGTFLWKAPEVVDRHHLNLQGIDLTTDFLGSVYIGFSYESKSTSIIANTSHCHIVQMDLATGKTISIIAGR